MKFYAWWIGGLTISIIALWVVLGIMFFVWFEDANGASQFGDSFGFVNSLFSGLALGGVVFAIVLQTIELRLQRKEIRFNRAELKKTADANTQLVKLNTLATLTQFYLNHPDRANSNMDAAYINTLTYIPDLIKRTLKYKLDNCASLLEKMYAELTNDVIGEPVVHDFDLERRSEWHRLFSFFCTNWQNYWDAQQNHSTGSGFRSDVVKSAILNHRGGQSKEINRLTAFVDCLGPDEEEYRTALEATKARIDAFVHVLDSDPERGLKSQDWLEGKKIYSDLSSLFDKSQVLQHKSGR